MFYLAANQGYCTAQYLLAEHYVYNWRLLGNTNDGMHLKQNYGEALRLYKLSSDLGDKDAKSDLKLLTKKIKKDKIKIEKTSREEIVQEMDQIKSQITGELTKIEDARRELDEIIKSRKL